MSVSGLEIILSSQLEDDSLIVSRLEDEFQKRQNKSPRITKEIDRLKKRGDQFWISTGGNLPFSIVAAGPQNNLHTIKIQIPLVNLNEHEAKITFDTLVVIFRAAMRGWEQPPTWPRESGRQAWSVWRDPKKSSDRIVKTTFNNITASTYGVPPDIIIYEITTNTVCIPNPKENNPFKRIIC